MRAWVVVSASAAPIALIGGWTLAAARQPAGYSAVRETISALAAHGATDRWIMTAGLALLGLCHLATAAGFTELGSTARTLLAVGGAATILVAALPQPTSGHVPAAAVGFVALAVWPACSGRWSRRAGIATMIALVALLGWLAVELHDGALLGLSERLLAGSEAVVPLALALTGGTVGRDGSRRTDDLA